MSPLEVTALIAGIWCAPAVLLSLFVAYHARKGTQDDRSTPHELYLQRLLGGGHEREAVGVAARPTRRPFAADRGGIRHGSPFRRRQVFPRTGAAGLNRVVPQGRMVPHYAPEEGALARISWLALDDRGGCSSGQWTAYLN